MTDNVGINRMPADVRNRDIEANHAANVLYSSVPSRQQSSQNTTPYHGSSSYEGISPEDERACCGIMTPVRRTFCLLVTFDLILIFIIWVLYTQISQEVSLKEAFKNEVAEYKFRESMFDVVLCAAWRCIPLLLAYAMWRIHNPWVVAVTTLVTCVFLLAKVFLFDFHVVAHNNVICYLLLLASLIISWVETWFLDFKVLPRERNEQTRAGLLEGTEREPLLSHDEFHTPPGSDDESHTEQGTDFESLAGSRAQSHYASHSSLYLSLGDQEKEYLEKAEETWQATWDMLNDPDGWKPETGKDHHTGHVHSKVFSKMGKLYRLEAYIDCSPEVAFEELVINASTNPQWNPTVLECRTLQRINDSTDISYNVAAEAAGGLVASRDFVNLRHWKTQNEVILSAGCAASHPQAPPTKKHVRGENGHGGWMFRPVPGDPNKCLFCWLVNTDLKGWMPQYVVDQALSGMLMEFAKHMRNHMSTLKPQYGSPS